MSDEDSAYQKARSGKPLALEARDSETDGRLFSPSIGRNKDVVVAALKARLAGDAHVLEIASGTGEHGAYATRAMPQVRWTYSDINPDSMASQRAWVAHEAHERLSGPHHVNTVDPDWGEVEAKGAFTAIFCANMIHIAPFEAAAGLLAGAGRILPTGGQLILYGPFARDGEIAESNARFSADLQRRDTSWGVRDLEREVMPLAKQHGLRLEGVQNMPANNLTVTFKRA